MKTKAGTFLLKKLSKEMDQLNAEFVQIAHELKSIKNPKMVAGEYLEDLLEKAKYNRRVWERKEKKVAVLCKLEHFLEIK